MKNLIYFLITIILVSCASENEKKALDEIANIYSAKTSYSKNFNSAAGQKTIREFNIKVSQSAFLDSLPKAPAASNIAYLTYKNFDKDEKEKYTKVNVSLISKENDTIKNSYDIPVLKAVAPKMNVYYSFSQDIINDAYEKLNAYKNSKDLPENISDVIKNVVVEWESVYGKAVDFQPIAISVFKDNKGDILQVKGQLLFENGKKRYYLIALDKTPGKDTVIGFNF